MKNVLIDIYKLFFLLVGFSTLGQNAKLSGIILDDNKKTVANVSVSCEGLITQSNTNGFYEILLPANRKIKVVFSHVSLKSVSVEVLLESNENLTFNPLMNTQQEQMSEVVVTAKNSKRIQGIVTISPELVRKTIGANPGIENILKTFGGVNSNNELSTQYSVRGGNYDENLVYVNEIEVYRPFLIRSGQQEGLSFINSDLVQNIDFSAGGFQAKYGDKLASVLDITYRKPTAFASNFEASFLGGSVSFDLVSKNRKWSAVTGLRYRNNSLLVKSQDTQTNFTPSFADIQTNINYQSSSKWQWSFLGNISNNKYDYQPLTRQTNFGTLTGPKTLRVYYDGQEKDQYTTYFGSIKSIFKSSESFSLKLIGSMYQAIEKEYFDILAQYQLSQLDESVVPETYADIGGQFNHAQNKLDDLISNLELKGVHDWNKKRLDWGAKYTRESIRDRVEEWEVIDSAGFSIPPPNLEIKNKQSYTIDSGIVIPYQYVRSTNFLTINRFSGFVQQTSNSNFGDTKLWYNIGFRFHTWEVSGTTDSGKSQIVWSPRAQIAIQPNWENEMLFRLSGGIYYQPPSYRELRNADGIVNPNVKAQQSFQIVLTNDYNFKMWSRPFKLVSELYYKSMWDVNTYTIDNVRIRYAANNLAKAYAQGLDIRLNGEFVSGTESWLSFGYLKTEENSQNKGYIARPTDQLLKFGLLFQDYMPNIPSMKVYLNLVYSTGLPGGSPSYSDPYNYQFRLKDYRRADLGFSKILIDKDKNLIKKKWFIDCKELAIGLEIFNLYNNQNAITNTWVRDVYSKNQYAIPNYMTSRVFNFKLMAKF